MDERPRDPRPPATADGPSTRLDGALSCRELVEFLDGYLSGELAGARRAAFDRHLVHCPDCQNYLDSYRATIRLGRQALRDEDCLPGSEVPEELVWAILAVRD